MGQQSGSMEASDSEQLLGDCASSSAPAVAAVATYAEAPALAFNAGVRAKHNAAWAFAFFATYGATLLLGAITASKANPAYAALTTESALNVRLVLTNLHTHAAPRARRGARCGRTCTVLRRGGRARERAGRFRAGAGLLRARAACSF
jgi:hypothetical protein